MLLRQSEAKLLPPGTSHVLKVNHTHVHVVYTVYRHVTDVSCGFRHAHECQVKREPYRPGVGIHSGFLLYFLGSPSFCSSKPRQYILAICEGSMFSPQYLGVGAGGTGQVCGGKTADTHLPCCISINLRLQVLAFTQHLNL